MSAKLSLLLLITLTFVIYLPSMWNQFVWDDEQFIYKNHYVQQFDLKGIWTENTIAGAGQISNYYRPLTTLTFAIDHALWGLRPFGFHLTNIALHTGAGGLLYLLFRQLKLGNQASFWLSLVFLLHPLQTEAVTYINSRGDSLFAFLSFFSLWCLALATTGTTYSLKLSDGHLTIGRVSWLGLSVLSFSLSLLAKELAIATLGLHGLVLGWAWLNHKGKLIQRVRDTFPEIAALAMMVLISFIYLYLRSTILNFDDSFNFYGEENDYTTSLVTRLLTFSKIIWIYLGLIVWPYPLHMERNSEIISSFATPWPWLTLSLIGLLLVTGWLEFRRYRSWMIWFGSLWFFGMLIPVSGLIPINGLLYEHWLYVPLVGFGVATLGLLRLFHLPEKLKRLHPHLPVTALCLVITCWSLLTIRQNYIWRSPIPFYEYTLQYAQSARLHNNLGMAYADGGQPAKALEHYQAALAMSNAYPQIYHNIGNTYVELGQWAQAETAYRQALSLQPLFQPSKVDLINVLITQNKINEALPLIDELIMAYPTDTRLKQLKAQLQQQHQQLPQ